MQKVLILPFVLVVFFSCSESPKPTDSGSVQVEKQQTIPYDSTLSDLDFCTEYPIINTDSIKKGIKQAGAVEYLLWPETTTTLHVQFVDGAKIDSVVKRKVIATAKEWEKYCGIKFDFSPYPKPEITVAFKRGKGSTSCIGISSKQMKPSMNLGWLTPTTSDAEYRRVVLHEFGHALGLIHEHQNPNDNPIQWNQDKVYQYYMQPPFSWTREMIDINLFQKYSEETINGTKFDPKSIMLYAIPSKLTVDGKSTTSNSDLSENDKKFIGLLYPKN